jgi:hypothetical protein
MSAEASDVLLRDRGDQDFVETTAGCDHSSESKRDRMTMPNLRQGELKARCRSCTRVSQECGQARHRRLGTVDSVEVSRKGTDFVASNSGPWQFVASANLRYQIGKSL